MRAVVTGCAGFIGSHLAERLVGDGWDVVGVDAFTPYYDPADKADNLAGLVRERRFELVRADLCDVALEPLLADRPVVFHLAAQPGVRASFGDGFGRYLHDNVEATQRVFEAALAAGVPRVVFASSSSVYGDAPTYPCVEATTPTRPRSPYGVTKRTCEHLAAVYGGLGLDTVALRYFTVYGPRQRPDMAIRRLCEAAFGGPRFVLHGDGLQSRDFTHVSDAVDATVRATLASPAARVFNVGGGSEATMRDVVAVVSRLSGRLVPVDGGPPQRGDVRRTGADTTSARTVLGWEPRTHLTDGIAGELDWVRQRGGVDPADARLVTRAVA